ncbi:MAG: transposase [Candidatus Heimdallarchaeota archaeon]
MTDEFCIMAILITNSVCWAKFERASLEKYSVAALSWMFRHSKIPWDLLLCMSVRAILHRFEITEGILVIDDSDKKRSKKTNKIDKVHKLKDKISGGFMMGQCIVFLVLVTPIISIPVGFAFYMPDPERTAWYKLIEKLKKQGVPPDKRPPEPLKNENYPTKQEIALGLLQQFLQYHSDIKVKCVLADTLYGTADFIDTASEIFDGVQVISQIKSNQKIRIRNKEQSVEEYFSKHPGTSFKIRIRGGKEVTVIVGSARMYVRAQGKKRFVIAIKYEGEKEYRYLIASDMTWRTLDIVQAYTLRWLVEVFFQDWKSYEGWGTLTKQPGEEGSVRSLILSLLVDLCLFFHPEQLARLENKLPAYTVGSLRDKIKVECLLTFIRDDILSSDNPREQFDHVAKALEKEVFTLAPSAKHMVGRDLGRLEPTPSLKYKAAS